MFFHHGLLAIITDDNVTTACTGTLYSYYVLYDGVAFFYDTEADMRSGHATHMPHRNFRTEAYNVQRSLFAHTFGMNNEQ